MTANIFVLADKLLLLCADWRVVSAFVGKVDKGKGNWFTNQTAIDFSQTRKKVMSSAIGGEILGSGLIRGVRNLIVS